ncbi:MAG: LysE family translocator [Caulobacter sp.]|nr:LysE family translocator [Caulobacter sp.]
MNLPIDPAVLPAFMAAMVLVELTPGPNMGYLAALSAERGRGAGLAAVLGVQLGLAVYLAASVLGLTELLLAWPPAWEILRWAGVGYLVWLAWDGWRGKETGPGEVAPAADSVIVLIGRGFLANILNPKAALFYVTLLPGFISETRAAPAVQAGLFGLGHLAVSGLVHGGIVLAAAGAGRLLARTTSMTRLRKAMSVGLLLVAAWLAWQTRR